MTLLFENKECSRCGGTGSYSYCLRYGSVCFKCYGKKVILTKRGAAAQEYLGSLRKKPVSKIKVGDLIYISSPTTSGGFTNRFDRIIKIKTEDTEIIFVTKNAAFSGLTPNTEFRVGETSEQKTKNRELALEYQATLTKAGTPRKRKAKVVEEAS